MKRNLTAALAVLALLAAVAVVAPNGQASEPMLDAPVLLTTIDIGGGNSGAGPEGVAVDTASDRVWVANTADNAIYVVSGVTNTLQITITDASILAPVGVAIDTAARRVYVTQRDGNSLLVLNADTFGVVTNIDLSGKVAGADVREPHGVVLYPALSRAYVAMFNPNATGYVYVINTGTNEVLAEIAVIDAFTPDDRHAYWLALDTTLDRLYVTHYFGGGSFIHRMDVHTYAMNGILNDDSTSIYPVTNSAGIAVRPSNGTLYVASEAGSGYPNYRLGVILWNGSAYARPPSSAAYRWPGLPLTYGRPVGVLYVAESDRVFVTAYQDNRLMYVNGSSTVEEGNLYLGDGRGPHVGLAYNPNNNRLYVANRLDGTLSVIQDASAGPTPTPTNTTTPTVTPSPTPAPCSADAFEPDNSQSQAAAIVPTFGYTQSHSFCGVSAPWYTDEDWVMFGANGSIGTPLVLTMTTSNLTEGADTFLTLYGPDEVTTTTKLATNDDFGGPGSLASRIVYTVTEAGMYYLHVNNVGPTTTAAKLRAMGTTVVLSAIPQRNYDLAIVGGPPLDTRVYLPLVARALSN